ncbi:SH3 domain-containing protein [Pseudorhizobium halotolerans]|jgi:SH3-like domain-containing protein|uniref:SH3 domain-containing protein n=2 Tax=Pseudorhizobium halotolerans TaxID=1233081 RepID=A0ABM8PG51_9HYPH|nr:SH3 domain-containing protein [Pseudorhizobium halotolerans]
MLSRRLSERFTPSLGLALAVVAGFAGLLMPALSYPQVIRGEEHCVVNVRTDDVLNVRRAAASSAPIVNRLRHDECGVMVIGECQGNWCPVEARHDAGWLHKRYISMVSPSLYCVTGVAPGDRLNLRAWSSPQSKVLARLPPNQCDISFLPYARNGWQKIRVTGWEGWVNRRYLSGQ